MEQGDQEMAEQARREAAEVFGAPPLKNRGQVAPRDDGRAGGLGGKKAQVERTCFQRPTELRQRKLQWLLERSQGSVDIRASAAWGAGAGVSSQCGEDVDAARVGDAAASSRHDVDDVRGYTRARSALIQEKSAKWQELYQEKKVTSSLRTVLLIGVFQELATRLQALLQDQDRLTKMHSVGWLVNGEQALNPKWIYQQRSPEKQTVEVSPQAPIPYSLALDAIQAVINNVGGPGVPVDAALDREDHGRGDAVCSAPVPTQAAGDTSSPGAWHSVGMRMPESGGPTSSSGQGAAIHPGQSLAGLVHGPLLCGLEAAVPVDTGGPGNGRRSDGQVRRDTLVRLHIKPHLCVPQSRLQNPNNICYLNACAQAFAWTGQLVDREDRCYGNATAAVKPVLANGKPHLPQSLAWHMLLGGWREVTRQHDVCQFMQHLLSKSVPSAYIGSWQARLTGPDVVVDTGALDAPILLDLSGATVADLLHAWHEQHTIHALHEHSGIVLLQLKRYKQEGSCHVKDQSAVRWHPGERIAVPVFSSSVGVHIRFEYFRIAWVLCHLGLHVETGHYQAVVCKPIADVGEGEPASWQGWVLNDNSKPRLLAARDADMLERNSDLVGLVFDPGSP